MGHGHYKAELAAGDVRLPLEIELQQISSLAWVVRYALQVRSELRLDQLELRGQISYLDAAGLEFATGEGEPTTLDGQPRAEALLAEPDIWDSLYIGRSVGARLRIKADGPVLKSLRLLDLRTEEDNPCYGVLVTVARDEVIPAGTELKFNMVFDGKG